MRMAIILTLSVTTSTALGQRGRLPEVGSNLPEITAFDASGREFSMTELKGNYSVLVFGCLT